VGKRKTRSYSVRLTIEEIEKAYEHLMERAPVLDPQNVSTIIRYCVRYTGMGRKGRPLPFDITRVGRDVVRGVSREDWMTNAPDTAYEAGLAAFALQYYDDLQSGKITREEIEELYKNGGRRVEDKKDIAPIVPDGVKVVKKDSPDDSQEE